jgi:hypothetical protein
MAAPKILANPPPPMPRGDPSLADELISRIEVRKAAMRTVDQRQSEYTFFRPRPDEIIFDPRDAQVLQDLENDIRRLELIMNQLRFPNRQNAITEIDRYELDRRIVSARKYVKMQEEVVARATIAQIKNHRELLEGTELPRLREQYERLMKENESLKQRMMRLNSPI